MVISGEASIPAGLVPPTPPRAAASSSISARGEYQTHLHEFSFPNLKSWGNQKFLRCATARKNGATPVVPSSSSFPSRSTARPRGENMGRGEEDQGLEKIREKLMLHLREATAWIDLGATDKEVARPSPSGSAAPVPAVVTDRPWNLRTRRSATSNSRDSSRSLSPEPAPAPAEIPAKSLRSRPEKRQCSRRRKFSVSLSKEEIEEDMYAVTGKRPPRRPKKRARNIQRDLDFLFPGLWLSEVNLELYKVDDVAPESGKR